MSAKFSTYTYYFLFIHCEMAEDEDANIITRIEKNKADSKKDDLNRDTDYTKYAAGGESKEVPASTALDENGSFFTKTRAESTKTEESTK